MKWGAWVRCRACGFEPSTSTDQAKSLLASDHYFSVEYLERAAEQFKEGRPLVFLDEQVSLVAKDIERRQYFLLNFNPEDHFIPCMKCGKRFAADDEKEEVLCPACSLEE
jgi:DNA-directed RNA polymerase subunit RPC12/RpoP